MSMLFGFAAAGFVVSFVIALALGTSWRRLLALAFAGIVLWPVWSVYSLAAGCPEEGECTSELGPILGLFVLAGWLLGVALAPAARGMLARVSS